MGCGGGPGGFAEIRLAAHAGANVVIGIIEQELYAVEAAGGVPTGIDE
jgi:hypothetical protein